MYRKKQDAVLIYNARLVGETEIIPGSWVLVREGIIRRTGTKKHPPALDIPAIDARRRFLAPGFIDLHIHGGIGKISRTQCRYGTTGFLRTLHAGKISALMAAVRDMRQVNLSGARCLGLNLEGPFLNKDMAGAQPKAYIREPDIRLLGQLTARGEGFIRIVTLACDKKRSISLIKTLRKDAITAAIGHTNAGYEQTQQAITAGASYAAHLYNRMGSVSSRNPGVVCAVLLDDRISAEIIADGVHVHPALIKLLVKVKPDDKIILVTDSAAAMASDELKLIKKVYRLEDYTIAGSSLTMIEAVKNMIEFGGVSLVRAVNMAAGNPARVIGLADKKGSITAGKDADLVLFDENFKVKMTIVGGSIVFSNS